MPDSPNPNINLPGGSPRWAGEHVCTIRQGATEAEYRAGEEVIICSVCGPRGISPSGVGNCVWQLDEDGRIVSARCVNWRPPLRPPTAAERAALGCPDWCTSGHGIWAVDDPEFAAEGPEPEHGHDLEHGVSLCIEDGRTGVLVWPEGHDGHDRWLTPEEAREMAAVIVRAAEIAEQDNAR